MDLAMGMGEAEASAEFLARDLLLVIGVTEFRCGCGAGVFEARKKRYSAKLRAWASWRAAVLRPYLGKGDIRENRG